MTITLEELLGLAMMIEDAEILEHCEPEKVQVTLRRMKTGELAAELSGDKWRE